MRWYRWQEPTLSLGYFQDDPQLPADCMNLPQVRRLTGGGALVHDRELTYSLILPPGQTLIKKPTDLYQLVHASFVHVLSASGFPITSRGQTTHLPEEEFLCFLRADENDLVFNSQKVLGSAQRRRRGALLQHGALLLHRSAHAPELPGLCDLFPGCQLPDIAREVTRNLSQRLGVCWCASELSDDENRQAHELVLQKYQSTSWQRPARSLQHPPSASGAS